MKKQKWTLFSVLIVLLMLPATQIIFGWPVKQSDLIGMYSYDGVRGESIQLKPNNLYYWTSSLTSGEKVKAHGYWSAIAIDLGWSGFGGRSVELEKVTFLNQRGQKVKFSGGACAGSLSDLETSTPSCSFTIHSNWGNVVSLGIADNHWVKERNH